MSGFKVYRVQKRTTWTQCTSSTEYTWSDSACSWATMMCSCPRACNCSAVIAVWCACRAVRHFLLPFVYTWFQSFMFILFSALFFFLHCSVASASSSLFTMMVCWDVALWFFRVRWSWLCRRSMWNLRWPLRLNLRKQAQNHDNWMVFLTTQHSSDHKIYELPPLSTKLARKRFLIGVCHHVSAEVLLVLGGKATGWTLVRA